MKLEKIIIKFLNKEANVQELEILDRWLADKKNESLFFDYIKTDFFSNINMSSYDLNAAKKSIKEAINRKSRTRKKQLCKKIGAITAIASMLVIGIYFNQKEMIVSSKINNQITEDNIQTGKNKAILTLGNGNQVVLGKGKTYEDEQLKSNGEKIKYTRTSSQNKIEYNQLSVPKGSQFYIELADGTEVWLNSDSNLRYPTRFEKGKKREVELLYGEAFFKVTSSNLNHGVSFHVVTKSQKVTVLGTEFNIKAYEEENEIKTTLLEGGVKISNHENNIILKPNQQSIISEKSEKINVNEVDVKHEVAWINGLFSFNDESLEKIMNTLSRWYDIQVVFENIQKKEYTFTGIVERSKSIYDILTLIEQTSNNHIKFEHYEKTLIVK